MGALSCAWNSSPGTLRTLLAGGCYLKLLSRAGKGANRSSRYITNILQTIRAILQQRLPPAHTQVALAIHEVDCLRSRLDSSLLKAGSYILPVNDGSTMGGLNHNDSNSDLDLFDQEHGDISTR